MNLAELQITPLVIGFGHPAFSRAFLTCGDRKISTPLLPLPPFLIAGVSWLVNEQIVVDVVKSGVAGTKEGDGSDVVVVMLSMG
eukprot:scaffold336211_cov55-Attheya_sp.AAC.2